MSCITNTVSPQPAMRCAVASRCGFKIRSGLAFGLLNSRYALKWGVSRGDRLTMRFLAEEDFPGDAVIALRAAGHDVLWISTDSPGITDQDVLGRNFEDARVLPTTRATTVTI